MITDVTCLGDNVLNVRNLLRTMGTDDAERMIRSSSMSFCADPLRTPIDNDGRIVLGRPDGESKGIIEHLLHWLSITRRLRFACLRYVNAVGATLVRGKGRK